MIDPYSRSFYPPNLHEYGIIVSNNNGVVVNSPKPIEYCVKHGFRIGYWKIKRIPAPPKQLPRIIKEGQQPIKQIL